MASAGAPIRRAAVAAASRSSARCSPGTRTSARRKELVALVRRGAATLVALEELAPRDRRGHALRVERHLPRARPAAPATSTAGSSRVHHRPVARRSGSRKMRALAARVLLERRRGGRGGRRRGSGRRPPADGRCRCPPAGSSTPRARTRCRAVAPSRRPVTACPMLPPTRTSRARLAQHRAERGGGRRLALGAGDRRHRSRGWSGSPSSSSAITGTPARARRRQLAAGPRARPGDTTTSVGAVNVSSRCAPSSSRTPSSRQAQRLLRQLRRRLAVGGHDPRAPRARGSRAAATPDRASPTTTTFFPSMSMAFSSRPGVIAASAS